MQIQSFYKGIFYTCLASLFWGMPQPLFFDKIKFIPALEVVIHRGLWSFLFLLIILTISGKIKKFFVLFLSYKKILFLSLTATLITINWIGFIFAVSINRVQDASMGYFITPMISIALGYFFLNEKISFLKFLSVFIMIVSLVFLMINIKTIPYLAVLIGISWSVYGLLRKQIDVSSEIGLLYESGFITLIASPYFIYLFYHDLGFFLNDSPTTSILLLLTGVVTIFPLFFFNMGIKFIPLGFVGVIFYLTPSFHFITSVFILKENINLPKLISFILIWIAVIIFVIDILKEEKKLTRVKLNY